MAMQVLSNLKLIRGLHLAPLTNERSYESLICNFRALLPRQAHNQLPVNLELGRMGK